MGTEQTVIRYFRQPYAFSTYSEEAKACDGYGEYVILWDAN